MKMKTKLKAGGLASNHNQTRASELPVKTEANELDQKVMAEIDKAELEMLAPPQRCR